MIIYFKLIYTLKANLVKKHQFVKKMLNNISL